MSTTTTPAQAREKHTLNLDASLPLAEHISRGNYAFVSEHYTPQNFQLSITGSREIALFDPNGPVSSEEMIARMKRNGFVPARLDDALAMGTQVPGRQRDNLIVFLGTAFHGPDGFSRVPVLDYWRGGRKLELRRFDRVWRGYFRFAAVRES